MRCFINITNLKLGHKRHTSIDKATHDKLSREVFLFVRDLFNENVDIDAYLLGNTPHECLFGFEKPSVLKAYADGWNDVIADDFDAALRSVARYKAETGAYPVSPSFLASAMEKTAAAMNDDFCAFADYAVVVDNAQNCFRARLTNAELEEITKHPENYAIIEVFPQ